MIYGWPNDYFPVYALLCLMYLDGCYDMMVTLTAFNPMARMSFATSSRRSFVS